MPTKKPTPKKTTLKVTPKPPSPIEREEAQIRRDAQIGRVIRELLPKLVEVRAAVNPNRAAAIRDAIGAMTAEADEIQSRWEDHREVPEG